MDAYLEGNRRERNAHVVTNDEIVTDYFQSAPRVSPLSVDTVQRLQSFSEVESTLTGKAAKEEAVRCFNCGHCNACDYCRLYCPEMAVKVEKAAKKKGGSRFLHVFAPCPTGWRIGSEMSVKIARLAVQTNVFPLYEVEGGVDYTLNARGNRNVKEYLAAQGRFKHLREEDYDRIQEMTDAEWALLLRKADLI